MKKLSIALIAMGSINFGIAQNFDVGLELFMFREPGIIGFNHEYLDRVQNGLTPNHVKYLENLVSIWDVSQTDQFNGQKGNPFTITFRSGNDHIEASFDRNGRIISARERFSNFAMPKPVAISILEAYPNWKIVKNKYTLWYTQKDRTKRIFKVLIQKDEQKKWLKIDAEGNIS